MTHGAADQEVRPQMLIQDGQPLSEEIHELSLQIQDDPDYYRQELERMKSGIPFVAQRLLAYGVSMEGARLYSFDEQTTQLFRSSDEFKAGQLGRSLAENNPAQEAKYLTGMRIRRLGFYVSLVALNQPAGASIKKLPRSREQKQGSYRAAI